VTTSALVSPVFAGREPELAALTEALADARSPDVVFTLIGGEAGVGKTRLVQEFAAQAAAEGVAVLVGNCVELGAEGLPFAPVTSALRQLAQLLPPAELADVVGHASAGLSRLLPALALPGQPPGGTGADTAVSVPELVAGLFGRLCALRPVLLVIEDLHWADQSTLELITFLLRALRDMPLLTVATYRSDEIDRRHPLRGPLLSWERVRSVRRIELGRLGRDQVAVQLGGILGAAPEAGLADLIFGRSDGNAYLVEELAAVRGLSARPGEVPPSLRDILLHRADSLGPVARNLLRTASVAGRRVAEPLLAAVSGLGDDQFYPALREAVDGHLLMVDAAATGYEFRHALTRDAVYADLLPGERARLHAAYAAALDADQGLAGDPATVPAALAHHWYSARDLPRALTALFAAADHALGSYAAAEALRHLELAIEVWPRVPDAAARAGSDLAGIYRRAAEAAYHAGDMDRALSLADSSLTALPPGDDRRRARVLEHRAMVLRDIGREEEAVTVLRQAMDLLPPGGASVDHAVVASSLAGTLLRVGDLVGAATAGRIAVDVARAAGAPREEADALITAGALGNYLGQDTEEALTCVRTGLDQALREGFPVVALRGYINLSDLLQRAGRHAEAIEVAVQGSALAARVGRVRTLGAYLAGNIAISATRLGRWAEAERLTSETARIAADGIYQISALETAAALAARRGDYLAAEELLLQARKGLGTMRDPQLTLPLLFDEALVRHGRGDPGGARERIIVALTSHQDSPQFDRYAWPLLWLGTRLEADEAVRARDTRSAVPAEAAAHSARLAELCGQHDHCLPEAAAYHATAAAERARGDSADSPDLWSAAAAHWRELADPWQLGYCLCRLAEAELATGNREAATAAVRESHALAVGLGAAPVAAQAEALARRARLPLVTPVAGAGPASAGAREGAPAGLAVTAGVPGPAAGGELARLGLTEREREILRHVAAGQSNSQIAKTLFISPKTVGVHVSNILAKLGVSGRVEAAAIAHRLGVTWTLDG
jgi:DNA-binding CsgD family transcriptional regulator/tetratricopeptide (TPR) repeat protein